MVSTKSNAAPSTDVFQNITPATAYHLIKTNAASFQGPVHSAENRITPIVLPDAIQIGDRLYKFKADGFYVQFKGPYHSFVNAGVVTITNSEHDPVLYVVTAIRPEGEFSCYELKSEENVGERRVKNEKLGVDLSVTLDDILTFGRSWSDVQRDQVLVSAATAHYREHNLKSQTFRQAELCCYR